MLRRPGQPHPSVQARQELGALCAEKLPHCLGRRQQHFAMRAETQLELISAQTGDEAGLTAFIHENFHYEVYITQQDAGRKIEVRRRIGDLSAVVASEPVPEKPITLWIASDPDLYRRDPKSFQAKTNRIGAAQAEIEAAEAEWLELEMLREELGG